MPSDPPLHVALGPDLRRPSVRLFKVIPGSFTTSVSTAKPNMVVFSNKQLRMYSTSNDIFSMPLSAARMHYIAQGMDTLHTHSTCAMNICG